MVESGAGANSRAVALPKRALTPLASSKFLPARFVCSGMGRRLKLLADDKVSADIAKLLKRSVISVKLKAHWLSLSLARQVKKGK